MDKTNIAEIKRRADIRDVWPALGGPALRGGRGQAWWRGGTGYSVSLDFAKGLWHDFVSGTGGDVVELVRTVQQCSFGEAIKWLANFTGMSPEQAQNHDHRDADTDWVADLRWATWWRMTAEILAEWALEEMEPWDLRRADLTAVLRAIRLGDAALVDEYRRWRKRDPVTTRAWALAGQRHDASVQRRVALWLRRYLDESA